MSNLEAVGGEFTSNKPYLFRALYQWIIDNDATPYLLVDATQVGVQIPRQHIKDGQIVLNAAPEAIQSWFTDNTAISFSARFSGKAQNIYIPMSALLAVYAQENGLGMAFPPEETETELEADAETLSNIDGLGQEKELLSEDNITKNNANKKKPSHLKVIK